MRTMVLLNVDDVRNLDSIQRTSSSIPEYIRAHIPLELVNKTHYDAHTLANVAFTELYRLYRHVCRYDTENGRLRTRHCVMTYTWDYDRDAHEALVWFSDQASLMEIACSHHLGVEAPEQWETTFKRLKAALMTHGKTIRELLNETAA